MPSTKATRGKTKNTMSKTKPVFEFNPSNHTYTLDGVKMTGVTTVLGVIAKPALVPWAAGMTAEYIKEKAPIVKDGNRHIYQVTTEILDEAKKAHTRRKEARGLAGGDTHTLLEDIIKNAIEFSEGFIQRPLIEQPLQIAQFIDWAIERKAKFLVSEQVMYHPDWFVGGTADFVCKIGTQKFVGDFKTQKKIWDRVPFFQMGAYRGMLESMGEKGFAGSLIIHIPEEGELDTHYSYDYESDLEGFLAALKLYRLLNNYD